MAQVLALVDDLFFMAKLLETAKQVGVQLRACQSADALWTEISQEEPRLIVFDLNARNDPMGAIRRIKASRQAIPLLGFVSHVEVALSRQAHEAGCDEVMPRSKFTRELATILAQVKSESVS